MPQHEGDKPNNLSWNQMEPRHDDGTECKKTRETTPGTYPEPGNEDETKCQKTRETIPGTLPENKRIEEMMMEQNARIPRTKKSRWNKPVSWKG